MFSCTTLTMNNITIRELDTLFPVDRFSVPHFGNELGIVPLSVRVRYARLQYRKS